MMEMSEQIAELAAALAKAQGKIEGAKKDGLNPHFRSNYATLASVWDACRDALTSEGLSIVQGTSATGADVSVTTLLLHSSGQWIKDSLTMIAADHKPQSVGSAISYGRRYGLAAMVGIAPEDDDANAAQGRGTVPSPPRVSTPLPNANKLPPQKIYPDKKTDKRTWSEPDAPAITDKDIPF